RAVGARARPRPATASTRRRGLVRARGVRALVREAVDGGHRRREAFPDLVGALDREAHVVAMGFVPLQYEPAPRVGRRPYGTHDLVDPRLLVGRRRSLALRALEACDMERWHGRR